MKRAAILVILILVLHIIMPFLAELKANTIPSVEVSEQVRYNCAYEVGEGYVERAHHGLYLELRDLLETIDHNLTIVLLSPEELRQISPYWTEAKIANESLDGGYFVTALFKSKEFAMHLWLVGHNETYPDPFDLMILPEGVSPLPVDENGRLRFSVSLNSTQTVKNVNLFVEPAYRPSSEIEGCSISSDLTGIRNFTNGDWTWIEIQSVPEGSHRLRFDTIYKNLRGNLQARVSCTLAASLTFSLRCYLDGKEIEFSKGIHLQYTTSSVDFVKSEVPWVYGYGISSQYLVNFTPIEDFVLRIDADNREQIDSIVLPSGIKHFAVTESNAYDHPCYDLTFSLDNPANSSIGLILYSKFWFVLPSRIASKDIPERILETYTNPSSCPYDGWCIDKDNPLIQQWSKQVAIGETNPYNVARLLFLNLTKTLNYSKSYEKFDRENEFASATLRNRAGVCRHFARAFAALYMARGLPVRTVFGTAFFVLNETWKKNHEWNEVYFPGYGWVTIDITAGVFGSLPESHMVYTLWPYVGNWSVIRSGYELAYAREKSQATLLRLVSIASEKLDELSARASWLGYDRPGYSKSIEESRILLSEARLLIDCGVLHETLLRISRAYVLIVGVEKSIEQTSSIVVVITVIIGLVMVAERRKLWKLFNRLIDSIRRRI